jgi:hypothetical protein
MSHRLFRLGDVLLVLSPGPSTLVRNTQRREVEGIAGFKLTRFDTVLDRLLVLSRFRVRESAKWASTKESSSSRISFSPVIASSNFSSSINFSTSLYRACKSLIEKTSGKNQLRG